MYFLEFAQNTPDYIHPRKHTKMQWLMSPPVLAQTEDEIKLSNDKVLSCVKSKLLKPDDLINCRENKVDVSHSLCLDSSALQSFSNLRDTEASAFECRKHFTTQPTSLHSDSGISTPVMQQSDMDLLDRVYLMCRDCENFSEFVLKLKDMMSQKACDSLLSLLFSIAHCSNLHHQCHLCLLTKVS